MSAPPPAPTSPRPTSPRAPPHHAHPPPQQTGTTAQPRRRHQAPPRGGSHRRPRAAAAAAAAATTTTTTTTSSTTTPSSPPAGPSFDTINRLLCSNPALLRNAPRHNPVPFAAVCNALGAFVHHNKNLQGSANFATGAQDRLDRLAALAVDLRDTLARSGNRVVLSGFSDGGHLDDEENSEQPSHTLESLHVLLLQTYKILLRKQPNRQAMGAMGVRALGALTAAAQRTAVACEGSNAVLNMCYEACNVSLLVDEVGVGFLAKFLQSNDHALQASAAGALQSICFQYRGRMAARDENAIDLLAPLLASEHEAVRTRSVGALHNLSSDPLSLRPMREAGCLPHLVKLLGSCTPAACSAAAGTIQNISREPIARGLLMSEWEAVEPLCDLLFGSDVQAQACAAGALLNLIGPEIGGGPEEEDERQMRQQRRRRRQHDGGDTKMFDDSDSDSDERDAEEDAKVRAKNVAARTAFKQLISESIAMGTIWQSLFEVDLT